MPVRMGEARQADFFPPLQHALNSSCSCIPLTLATIDSTPWKWCIGRRHDVAMKVSVLFTPADFSALATQPLHDAVCVVFDILRATTSIVTALHAGAEAIVPVDGIAEALALREKDESILLAGERNGLRIDRSLTGSIDFNLGNSPREFTAESVRGRKLAVTTTNGTRALRACRHASTVIASSFLNLSSTARFVSQLPATRVLLICSGTHEFAAYEDTLAAGAMSALLRRDYEASDQDDSAPMARMLFEAVSSQLADALAQSQNGARLLTIPELAADVAFCAQLDSKPCIVTADREGWLRAAAAAG